MTGARPVLLLSTVFSVGLSLGLLLHSQPALNAGGLFMDDPQTPEQRAALFAHLSREVAELERQGNVLKTVVSLVSPTVVHIDAEKAETSKYGRQKVVEEAGSGVIFEYKAAYYVLTNRHVIYSAKLSDIAIRLSDNREIQPTRIWEDPETDIAVMAVSAPRLIPARIGDSGAVEIGDFVLAVGSPFGLSQSVTYGIISAKGRRDLELGSDGVKFQDFIQTDAAINPGNSGGPLINLRGEVIGINTAIASNSGGNEGIGFSIPVNMVISVARQLIEYGSVTRARLGVYLDNKFTTASAINLGLPGLQGAHITQVEPDSPAQRSGLRADDVVLQFNGVWVEDDSHLINLVSLADVGSEVPVLVYRDGQQVRFPVRVGTKQP